MGIWISTHKRWFSTETNSTYIYEYCYENSYCISYEFSVVVKDSNFQIKIINEVLIALMMEAARASETLVNFYQTTRHYNPEDNHLRTHCRENLESYKLINVPCLKTRLHLVPRLRRRWQTPTLSCTYVYTVRCLKQVWDFIVWCFKTTGMRLHSVVLQNNRDETS
jgi:hypothetical protein